MGRRSIVWTRWAVAWVVIVPTVARSQPPPPAVLPALDAGPGVTDVYVSDSFAAKEAIGRATRLVESGRWAQAVELLQHATEQEGDKLLSLEPGLFTGVREFVTNMVAAWPIAGVAAYQEWAESKFRLRREALPNPRDVPSLVALFESYFCTEEAAKLADFIGQLALEAGDVELAKWVYARVLASHPNRHTYSQRYATMLHVLAAVEGSGLDPETPELDPTARLRWMGQDRPVAEILAEIASAFAALRRPALAEDWPMFAGSIQRDRLGTCLVDEPGLIWQAEPFKLDGPQRPAAGLGNAESSSPNEDRDLSMYPIVGGGLVLVQWNGSIAALNRNTGSLVWRFGNSEGMVDTPGGPDGSPWGLQSVAIRDDRVYACLPAGSALGSDSVRRPAEIVCLRLADGRLLWRASDAEPTERGSSFGYDSAPLVDHGAVFALGRRRRGVGFDDAYLCSFDASNGSPRFRVHLASASNGGFGVRPAATSLTAGDDGVIYAGTNLGAIAAVSAAGGSVRWLRTYSRSAIDPSRSAWAGRDQPGWEVSAMIRRKGTLLAHPADSDELMMLNASDGRILRTIPSAKLDGWRTLLGARDDLLCGAGTTVSCFDLREDRIRWRFELLESEPLTGRGLWADDQLWIPTRSSLIRFRIEDGERSVRPWSGAGEPGNLVAVSGMILVTANGGVQAFGRKSDLWSRLRERMASAPEDPMPALEFAEVALRSGDLDEARVALNESVRRANVGERPSTAVRHHMFDVTMSFTQSLSSQGSLDAKGRDELLGIAQDLAPDAAAHVECRLQFGQLLDESGLAAQAVALYQQILTDRTLHEFKWTPTQGRVRTAGEVARERIAKAIDQHGPSVYDSIESEAKSLLDGAMAAKDLALLARVVDGYPNSRSAPRALQAQGDLLLQLNRWEDAARSFALAYRLYPQADGRPELLKRIVDAHQQDGQSERAYRWLVRAAREFPSAQITHEGRFVRFSELLDQRIEIRALIEPSRPRVTLPLKSRSIPNLHSEWTLGVPRFGDHPTSRWGRVFVISEQGVRALDSRTGADLWNQAAKADARPELLLAGASRAVFASQHEVLALDASTGKLLWRVGPLSERPADPNADWEDGTAIRLLAIQGERLVCSQDNGHMRCIDLQTGQTLWSEVRRPVPSGRIRWVDRWLAYTITQDDRTVVCLMDSRSGAWLGAVTTHESRSVEDLFLTLDGQPVVLTARSISSYDTETGSLRWRFEVDGRIRRESVHFDLDSLYFTDDGTHVTKLDAETGSPVWNSDRVIQGRDDDFQVDAFGDQLVISTSSEVCALDRAGGVILWRGTTDTRPRFLRRLPTSAYEIALDVPALPAEAGAAAYFFDHRFASGALPKDHGVLPLGMLTELRSVLAADDALWLQSADGIRLLSHP